MRATRNIFETKASRILRCLLLNPGKTWTIRELGNEVQVSVGHTHAVVTALIQNGYLARNEVNLLEVVDPIRMLKRWASYNQYITVNNFLDYYSFEIEIEQFIGKLRNFRYDYALTSLSGALLVAPYVRPVIVELYIGDIKEVDSIKENLHLKPIPREGNVRLVIPYDMGVFYKVQIINDVKVVSNVQLYVDLLNYPARGEEAAQQVLKLIQKNWSQVFMRGQINV